MQVTETQNEGLKRAYKLLLTAQELDDKVMDKLKDAQPEIEMKGFRKGKVPLPLLKKQFGQRVLGEAMQEAVDGAMAQHFEDKGERPAAEPAIKMTNEDWKEGDDVELEMSYEALPEIPEVDFGKVAVEKLVAKADDAGVEDALKNLAESAQDFADRKKGSKAKDGDQVVIDFVGRVDGEAFEGGTAEDYPLVLGSNSFIPGFEDQLVGVKVDEEKIVTVTFPEEYQAEHLAGKEAEFTCTVKAVKAPSAAEINDELAQKYGVEDLETLKGQIRERLEQEYNGAARAVMKRKLLDQLDGLVSFELPPSMVEAEAKQIAHQLWHEENPDVQGHDHPEIEATDEHTKLAERRVRLGLVLAELISHHRVSVDPDALRAAVEEIASTYQDPEEVVNWYYANQEQLSGVESRVLEDRVVEQLLEAANVTENACGYQDAIALGQQANQA